MNTHSSTILQNTFTPTTLQIPAKLLLCIREFAARSDIRYYLNTLHFSTRAGRAYISATDGHMGGIIRHKGRNIRPLHIVEILTGRGAT